MLEKRLLTNLKISQLIQKHHDATLKIRRITQQAKCKSSVTQLYKAIISSFAVFYMIVLTQHPRGRSSLQKKH